MSEQMNNQESNSSATGYESVTTPPVTEPDAHELKRDAGIAKYAWYIAAISIFFALAVGSLYYFWAVYPYDPLVINNTPVPVIPDKTKKEQVIFLKVDYCKNVDAEGKIQTFIVTKYREIHIPSDIADRPSDRNPKGCGVVDFPVIMSPDLIPSEAHIRVEVDYKVNPIRTVHEQFTSKPFSIIE